MALRALGFSVEGFGMAMLDLSALPLTSASLAFPGTLLARPALAFLWALPVLLEGSQMLPQ